MVAENLPRMCKDLGLIPSVGKKKKKKIRGEVGPPHRRDIT